MTPGRSIRPPFHDQILTMEDVGPCGVCGGLLTITAEYRKALMSTEAGVSRCGMCLAKDEETALLEEIAERRADPVFRERLDRLVAENRGVLDKLAEND